MAHLMLEMLWLWHGVGIANFLLRTRWVNFVPRGLPPVRNTFTLWWSHIGNAIIYIFLLCFTLSVPLPCCRAVEYSIYGCVASSFSRENCTLGMCPTRFIYVVQLTRYHASRTFISEECYWRGLKKLIFSDFTIKYTSSKCKTKIHFVLKYCEMQREFLCESE